ncbi:hypothetical protein ACFQY5_26725 [Paeniroseomonas aquatica]|uniref:HTH cro/C1-type domain-containing protein n=1 Tax=Paeniroseomonas aquatica TaxID=373043 RepID=A0ABT8AAS7_9PROT|nr:hypothetical protein [Paeniroseomonas aquatica]MDN3566856.1 hypothetical protein [Paeniroseomonas aquatica]
MAERIESRLDRLGLEPAEAAKQAGLPADFLDRLRAGRPPPRGQKLVALAEVLATSVSYLVGLDPDVAPPPDVLEEDQATLGLLAGDEEALLRAYRRLDLPTRAAVVLIARRLAGPEPEAGAVRQVGKGRR